ncbi:MAG: hypothetical protein WBP79_16935, partial [Candidatus Acidiferrales bacterium]
VDLLENGVQVSSGSGPSSIDLVFSSHPGSVDGVVTKDDGLPAPGSFVVLIPDSLVRRTPASYFTATTDQYGRFTISAVVPRKYKAFAWDRDPDGAYEDPEFLKPFQQKAQAFNIGESEKKSLELHLIEAPAADSQ